MLCSSRGALVTDCQLETGMHYQQSPLPTVNNHKLSGLRGHLHGDIGDDLIITCNTMSGLQWMVVATGYHQPTLM